MENLFRYLRSVFSSEERIARAYKEMYSEFQKAGLDTYGNTDDALGYVGITFPWEETWSWTPADKRESIAEECNAVREKFDEIVGKVTRKFNEKKYYIVVDYSKFIGTTKNAEVRITPKD